MRYHLRAVLFVLAVAAVSAVAQSQNAPASKADIDHCTDWLNSLVPERTRLDLATFCAGLKQQDNPGLSGWYTAKYCGRTAKPETNGKQPYCASSGAIAGDWTIAAGFKSAIGDGGDLLPPANGDSGASATLYTRTPAQIGAFRLPAGIYEIAISHPTDGWKLAVATQAGKKIGTVPLEEDEHSISSNGELAISVHYAGFHCKDPVNVHELVFSYGGRDLYACIRPDRIAPSPEDAAMQGSVAPHPVTAAQ